MLVTNHTIEEWTWIAHWGWKHYPPNLLPFRSSYYLFFFLLHLSFALWFLEHFLSEAEEAGYAPICMELHRYDFSGILLNALVLAQFNIKEPCHIPIKITLCYKWGNRGLQEWEDG